MTGPGSKLKGFTVDGWDPAYGNAMDFEEASLLESTARVDTGVEVAADNWAPVPAAPSSWMPSALLFVDGVRRIDARVWLDTETTGGMPSVSMCASIAAGVVCCCEGQAHVTKAQQRRLLATTSAASINLVTTAATWSVVHTPPNPDLGVLPALNQAIQKRLGELEVIVALEARDRLGDHGVAGDDLLVVDGPLHGRSHLPRSLGYIKTHRSEYLPAPLNAVVGALSSGERTPIFLLGSSWDRHTWYLRLPCRSRAPWAGIVRIECSADLSIDVVKDLAALSQEVLPRHASQEFRDPRAPQNLNPIGGLEKQLRHLLGDQKLLFRSLQVASN